MTIAALVDRGLELRACILLQKLELDGIEEQLIARAQAGDHVPLFDQDRAGKQYLARGSAQIVPIIFTADKIIGSFKDGSIAHAKIATAAGAHLKSFYQPQTTWEAQPKSGKAYRALAAKLLGKAGPALVTASLSLDKYGFPKSDIKIDWSNAKAI